MKVTVNVDCTPQEARAFLGLPDVAPVNDYLVEEVRKRFESNAAMMQPEELMKSWMSYGGMAQEQFMKMMTAATGGSFSGKP
ncbi:MAG: hypothetical protein B7Y99_03370 [Caulobacterales bacterium 32-69-10]|nr:MAG: hypothetical protein B7Y99_03370 [Caulobacterales bacterium 32-69-10]